jgi:hypothetical protein
MPQPEIDKAISLMFPWFYNHARNPFTLGKFFLTLALKIIIFIVSLESPLDFTIFPACDNRNKPLLTFSASVGTFCLETSPKHGNSARD